MSIDKVVNRDGFVHYVEGLTRKRRMRKDQSALKTVIVYGKNMDRKEALLRKLRMVSFLEGIAVVNGYEDKPVIHKSLLQWVYQIDIDEVFERHEQGKRS